MNRALPLTALLLAGAASASVPVRAGVDLGLLLRQEAGGQRTGLLTGGPRASLHLGRHLALAGSYAAAHGSDGTVVRASTWYHRVSLRPELHLPVRSAAFVLAAGPALTWVRTTLEGPGAPALSSRYLRAGLSTGAALDVHLRPLVLRAGLDFVWSSGRQDVQVGLGALFDLGGTP